MFQVEKWQLDLAHIFAWPSSIQDHFLQSSRQKNVVRAVGICYLVVAPCSTKSFWEHELDCPDFELELIHLAPNLQQLPHFLTNSQLASPIPSCTWFRNCDCPWPLVICLKFLCAPYPAFPKVNGRWTEWTACLVGRCQNGPYPTERLASHVGMGYNCIRASATFYLRRWWHGGLLSHQVGWEWPLGLLVLLPTPDWRRWWECTCGFVLDMPQLVQNTSTIVAPEKTANRPLAIHRLSNRNAILSGHRGKGCCLMCKIPDMCAKEIAESQKLLHFMNVFWWWSFPDGLQLDRPGFDSFLSQTEPKVCHIFASEMAFGQVDFDIVLNQPFQ